MGIAVRVFDTQVHMLLVKAVLYRITCEKVDRCLQFWG